LVIVFAVDAVDELPALLERLVRGHPSCRVGREET
jgi:hypothetical protein